MARRCQHGREHCDECGDNFMLTRQVDDRPIHRDQRWDRYYLSHALVAAQQSKDPNTRVGSVIVGPDGEIRCSGFNGLARGLADTPQRLQNRELKLKLIIHAEQNAILQAARVGTAIKGCVMYTCCTDDTGSIWGGAPCVSGGCCSSVIQSGIIGVVTYRMKIISKWFADHIESKELLREAGVSYREVLYLP